MKALRKTWRLQFSNEDAASLECLHAPARIENATPIDTRTQWIRRETRHRGRFVVEAELEVVLPPPHFDVSDAQSVATALQSAEPDWVLHLAAQSSVAESLQQPIKTYQINTIGTANVVNAAVQSGFAGRLLFVSSADVYGAVEATALPIKESQPGAPRNPYAASKLAAEAICLEASRRSGFDVVIARPFNHIGPGQDTRFAVASFAAQIAAIAARNHSPTLAVGDLSVERDFTDVRDVIRAYFTLFERGQSR